MPDYLVNPDLFAPVFIHGKRYRPGAVVPIHPAHRDLPHFLKCKTLVPALPVTTRFR